MIDTVRLRLRGYEVEPSAALTVEPVPYEVRSGELVSEEALLWTANGADVRGKKAYFNSERFNFTLLPPTSSGDLLAPEASAFVSFSLPKVLHGTNVEPLDRDGAAEAFRLVEVGLAAAGVRTDLRQAFLSRVDLFRNVSAAEPFRCYAPLFDALEARRKQKRDYGSTFLWHNTLREVCVYDKKAELEAAGFETQGLPKNFLRFEYRCLKPRTVLEVVDCGGNTVGDLVRGYGAVRTSYRRAMANELFRATPSDVEAFSGSQLEQDMRAFKARYGRVWLARFTEAFGARELSKLADVDTLRELVERLSGDRNKAWRFAKKLRQYALDFESVGERPTVTLRSLYEELQGKVLAA